VHRRPEAELASETIKCVDELRTHHHGGEGAGPGIVRCGEVVILAAFEERRPRTAVDADDFPKDRLKDTNLSLARREHTTRRTFDEQVIGGGTGPKGSFLGAAWVEARVLRELEFIMVSGQLPATTRGRAVCVLDRVDPGDHDGHAALGFSEALEALPLKQKSLWRTTTRNNLVQAFGNIRPLDEVLPAATTVDGSAQGGQVVAQAEQTR